MQFLSDDKDAKADRLSPRQRAQLHHPGDPPRVVVPNDADLKYDILLEAHDAPMSGHLGREKTYQAVSQTFWWSRFYKWRVKPSGHASAPQQSLPVPADCWKSMSLDFVFGLPADDKGNTGILVQDGASCSYSVFRYHGLPETIVSDLDPRFTGAFWDSLFQLLGSKLTMSTADHPETDGQTERAVYPVLFEWVTTPPGTTNLAGRRRGLHRKWGGGSESLFLPGLGDRARVFEKTIVVVYRRQVDVDQPG
ncbi:Hypothetical protein PHPALM_9158 [Phytophthora palmivora]|uniref:Integrase zinc-binding domain-containing protein n=1 Tax=Phytophthora palmivora TaxID=4796 RepID=A0A2P4Y803_9STRA|nr:Hypothetical protein PHPALM_9158 [Phytophthora palmivora]